MSELDDRVDKVQKEIDIMMKQIDELYTFMCKTSTPFGAFLWGEPKYRKAKAE